MFFINRRKLKLREVSYMIKVTQLVDPGAKLWTQ